MNEEQDADNPPEAVTPPALPEPSLSQAESTPPPNANPSARIVVEGRESEREQELSEELAETRAELDRERQQRTTTETEKKQREQRINELEDQNRRLMESTTERPKRRRSSVGCFTSEED